VPLAGDFVHLSGGYDLKGCDAAAVARARSRSGVVAFPDAC
jgi:hypothetical protein